MKSEDPKTTNDMDRPWGFLRFGRGKVDRRALLSVGGISSALIGLRLMGAPLSAALAPSSLEAARPPETAGLETEPAMPPEVPLHPTPLTGPRIEPAVGNLGPAGFAVRSAPLLVPPSELADLPFSLEWIPSPYHRTRRQPINTLVFHTTAGSFKATIAEFQNSARRVSAHYVVSRDGRVVQMVQESQVANHAGIVTTGPGSRFYGTNPNQYSIGLEIENPSIIRYPSDFPPAQKTAVLALARDIVRRNRIPVDRDHLVAHSEINPGSREDPGPGFPWSELLAYLAE